MPRGFVFATFGPSTWRQSRLVVWRGYPGFVRSPDAVAADLHIGNKDSAKCSPTSISWNRNAISSDTVLMDGSSDHDRDGSKLLSTCATTSILQSGGHGVCDFLHLSRSKIAIER